MPLPSMRWMNAVVASLALMAGAQSGVAQSDYGVSNSIPKGAHLQAGGAAFFGVSTPRRLIYVGEAVPLDIEVGLRHGRVQSLNGLPKLAGSAFTLNRLSKRTDRGLAFIQGGFFDVLTWHTALAAVTPGVFSLAAEIPLSVRMTASSAAHRIGAYGDSELDAEARAVTRGLRRPASRSAAKDILIKSAPFTVRVLPLPTQGRPQKFNGAVGAFQLSSDVSATSVKQGEPLTLRVYVRGKGNFSRVDLALFKHLDHWKAYPVKSAFSPSDAAADRGVKVFEQSLIATAAGEQSIPGIDFYYFNPSMRRYEHAKTSPIRVAVAAGVLSALRGRGPGRLRGAAAAGALPGLRPDHRHARTTVRKLRPLYLQEPYLMFVTALALLLAAAWVSARPKPARATAKARAQVLARLEMTARSGDILSFFEEARGALLLALSARWQMPTEKITGTELRARLGTAGEDIERLFAIADEARYGGGWSGVADLRHWLGIVRGQLADEQP